MDSNGTQSIVTRCAGCGAKNRIAVVRLGEGPRCGKCKRALEPAAVPIYAVDDDFDLHVTSWTGVVVAEFYAVRDEGSKAALPMLEALAAERIPGLKIVKLNIDEEPLAAFKFKVRSVPTFAIFKDGAVAEIVTGPQPLEALRATVRRHLDR